MKWRRRNPTERDELDRIVSDLADEVNRQREVLLASLADVHAERADRKGSHHDRD